MGMRMTERQLKTSRLKILRQFQSSPLEVEKIPMSARTSLFSIEAFKGEKAEHRSKTTELTEVQVQVNNIYTVDDYIFLDISYKKQRTT